MNENAPRHSIDRIAKDLRQLYQEQVDTLQQGTLTGLAAGELKQYSERKRKTCELRAELRTWQFRRP
jgi:hypothetical protein